MNAVVNIFNQIFAQQPLILRIPNWTGSSVESYIHSQGLKAPGYLYLALGKRTDSELHFYNDAYQSYIGGMVTPGYKKLDWFTPMEEIFRAFSKSGQPVTGFNLYLSGTAERKKGKTCDLLLKAAMAKGLDHLFRLSLQRDELIKLICSTNDNSVLDALFLSQIMPSLEMQTENKENLQHQT